MSDRLDVRRMLLTRGWTEDGYALLRKGDVSVCYGGSDAFITGPARRSGNGRATFTAPSSVPTRVIVAACEAWSAASAGNPEGAPGER